MSIGTPQPPAGTSQPPKPKAGPLDRGMALVASSSTTHPELEDARQACAALDADDPLQPLMHKLLETVEHRLQQPNVGLRPALPDRHTYLNKLKATNARRPQRAAAYDAMDSLLTAVWTPMTVAQRKQRAAESASVMRF